MELVPLGKTTTTVSHYCSFCGKSPRQVGYMVEGRVVDLPCAEWHEWSE